MSSALNKLPSSGGGFPISPDPRLPSPGMGDSGSSVWMTVPRISNGGGVYSVLRDNNSYAQGITNGTASLAYPLRFPEDVKEAKYDVGVNEFIAMGTKLSSFHHELHNRYQPRSLSRINYWLKQDKMGREYGKQKDLNEFLMKWAILGVSNTNLWDQGGMAGDNSKYNNELTLHVIGRVLVRDIWLATGEKAMPGDTLWLVAVKCQRPENPYSVKPDNSGVIKECEKIILATQPCTEDRSGLVDQYWQLLPWLGKMGAAPPVSLYQTMFWMGSAMKIGKVTDRVGNPRNMVQTYNKTAVKAVSPDVDGAEYRALLQSMPEVEIQLGLN